MKMIKLRLLLCLLPILATTFVLGGVIDEGSDLPEDQVEQVLALYRKHCSSGYGVPSLGGYGVPSLGGYGYGPSSYGQEKVNIVCKEGHDSHQPPKKNIIRIPTQTPKKNILFVEAPTLKLKHQINLISHGAPNPRTVIYVLPQKSSHHLKVWDKRIQGGVSKPQVFFLKGDKSHHASHVPEYGVPYPQPQPIIPYPQPQPIVSYPQPQPIVVTTPSPAYGLPVTTYRPSTGYVVAPTQTPPVAYGLPSKQFSLLQSDSGLVPFDPSSLGPEYEIVPADQGTRDAYQNLFAAGGVQSAAASQVQPQFQLQTEVSYEGQNQDDQRKRETSETVVQPLNPSSLFKSADGNGAYAGGKLVFPEESVQSYRIQPFNGDPKQVGIKTIPRLDDDITDEQAEKSIKALIAQYEKRREKYSTTSPPTTSKSTTTTTTTTPRPETSSNTPTSTTTEKPQARKLNTNLFDQDFVRTLIANANSKTSTNSDSSINDESVLSAVTSSTTSPRSPISHSRVVARYFRNDANQQRNSFNLVNTQPEVNNLPNRASSSKRSVLNSGFEIFPADFVSYSYSKHDDDGRKTN